MIKTATPRHKDNHRHFTQDRVCASYLQSCPISFVSVFFCMCQATISAAVLKNPDRAHFSPEEYHPKSGVCEQAGHRELQLRGQE